MDAYDLQPGRYILTQEVKVPRPDRRCRYDWRVLQTVPAGMTFLVEHRDEGDGWISKSIRPEGKYGDKIYLSALSRSEAEDYDGHGTLLKALIPRLQHLPWDIHSTLDFRFSKEWHSPLLDTLLEMGKITLNDVVEACNKLEASYKE